MLCKSICASSVCSNMSKFVPNATTFQNKHCRLCPKQSCFAQEDILWCFAILQSKYSGISAFCITNISIEGHCNMKGREHPGVFTCCCLLLFPRPSYPTSGQACWMPVSEIHRTFFSCQLVHGRRAHEIHVPTFHWSDTSRLQDGRASSSMLYRKHWRY